MPSRGSTPRPRKSRTWKNTSASVDGLRRKPKPRSASQRTIVPCLFMLAPARPACRGCASAPADAEQLDLEDERRVRRDHVAGAAFAVGDRRRADEPGLAADLHALHTFGPALDDAVERKTCRLAALVG